MSSVAFSIDLTSLLSYAAIIFNGLVGIVAVVGGFRLGIGFLRFLISTVGNIF